MRPKSDIWIHFQQIAVDPVSERGSRVVAVCLYCGLKYNFPNATKLSTHIHSKCKKCPRELQNVSASAASVVTLEPENDLEVGVDCIVEESENSVCSPEVISSGSPHTSQLRQILTNTSNHYSSSSTTSTTMSSGYGVAVSVANELTISGKRKRKMQQPVAGYVERMDPEEQELIDAALARAIYSSGVSLSLTENEDWKRAFQLLRPSYKPPTRNMLRNSLLESEYTNVMVEVGEMIKKTKYITLVSDGWTNVNGNNIINFMLATPEPIFLKSIKSDESMNTGEYIASMFIEIIESLGPEKFVALITDYAANMETAWKLVTEKYPHIYTLGCSTHILNQLIDDIMNLQTMKDLYKSAKDVVKFIKNSERAGAIYSSKMKQVSEAVPFKLPNNTKWQKVITLYNGLVRGKKPLQETFLIDDLHVDGEIIKTVFDEENFWCRIVTSLDILKLILEEITLLESDKACLSDVVEAVRVMNNMVNEQLPYSHLPSEDQLEIRSLVSHRSRQCCKTVHLTAYLLDPHPSYRGQCLNDEELASALDCIIEMSGRLGEHDGRVLASLANYRTSQGLWSRASIWDSANYVDPWIWWNGLCASEPLKNIAVPLLTIPPSTAAGERVWSAFAKAHPKKTDRITSPLVNKLLSIQINLQQLRKQTKNDSEHIRTISALCPAAAMGSDCDDSVMYHDSNSDSESEPLTRAKSNNFVRVRPLPIDRKVVLI